MGTALTASELKVLAGICLGGTKGSVAAKMGCRGSTVKTHSLNILARTAAQSMGNALAVAVARGEVVIKPEPGEPLPTRQQKILIGFARGLKTKEIADELELSPHSVKNEIALLYQNLGAVSRAHLVYLGFKTGNLTVNRRKQDG